MQEFIRLTDNTPVRYINKKKTLKKITPVGSVGIQYSTRNSKPTDSSHWQNLSRPIFDRFYMWFRSKTRTSGVIVEDAHPNLTAYPTRHHSIKNVMVPDIGPLQALDNKFFDIPEYQAGDIINCTLVPHRTISEDDPKLSLEGPPVHISEGRVMLPFFNLHETKTWKHGTVDLHFVIHPGAFKEAHDGEPAFYLNENGTELNDCNTRIT